MGETLAKYSLDVDGVPARITIEKSADAFVPIYRVTTPAIEPATAAVLDAVREKMLTELSVRPIEILSPDEQEDLKQKFLERSAVMIKAELPNLPPGQLHTLSGILTHRSLGLGEIELLLRDDNLEEIVVNAASEPIWVYHRQLGWLKSNITLHSETEIYNYAAMIGRKVGTQITHLRPLMDAYLTSGDRGNATLFPISSKGNTLTIRKFARKPWTITDFINAKTISLSAAAFLWMAIQYEFNILVAGGTASGKTSLLNVLTNFIPPNHRIISIEDTREIQLPDFLHWVPMTTRPQNAEGKGEVTMLELMVNALRMRPDRIIVGEMRRAREAQVLFEAIHTGHSVYSTIHANTAEETLRRLTNPPLDIPPALLESLQLIAVMHRDRRREIRRVMQIAEITSSGLDVRMELNTLFRWIPTKDDIIKVEGSVRVISDVELFTGMTPDEVAKDLAEKELVLRILAKQNINDINEVGHVISEYYTDPGRVLARAKKGSLK